MNASEPVFRSVPGVTSAAAADSVTASVRPRRILAVASEGGHWIQLLRLAPVFAGHSVEYLTTNAQLAATVTQKVHVVRDANLWTKWQLLLMSAEVLWLMLRLRPDVVITTGAAPGLAAVASGRLLGARTVWLDSMANAEGLSGSGRIARQLAHQCLTQWDHLAEGQRVQCWGSVL